MWLNPYRYRNKELLVMELLIRKDSSSEFASKKFEILDAENDYINVFTSRNTFNAYPERYFYAEEITSESSMFFRSEKDVDAIFLKIQLVDKV